MTEWWQLVFASALGSIPGLILIFTLGWYCRGRWEDS